MSENVIAKIKDLTITEAEVDSFIDTMPAEQKQYASNPMFRQQIVQQLISIALLSEYGKEQKLEETDEYAKLLESAKRDILAQLAVQNLIKDVKVEDAEVKNFYDENTDRFMSDETVSARHILVDDEAKCNEIKAEIEAGKAFEDAAKEYSSCPSNAQGGDLGAFGHGQMVPEFDKAAFEAELNTVVGPVQTQFGYHLITVYDKKEAAVTPFEEVKDSIAAQLTQRRQAEIYNEKVAELHDKYVTE